MHPRQALANAIADVAAAKADYASLGGSPGYIVRTDEEQAAAAELTEAREAFNALDCNVTQAAADLAKVPPGQLHAAHRFAAEETLARARTAARRVDPRALEAARTRLEAAQQVVADLGARSLTSLAARRDAQDSASAAQDHLKAAVLAALRAELDPKWHQLQREIAELAAIYRNLGLGTPQNRSHPAPDTSAWVAFAAALPTDANAVAPSTEPEPEQVAA